MTRTLSRAEGRAVIVVDLPWPAKPLHPNARPHHMKKARATKDARADAYSVTKPKLRGINAKRLRVAITFHPPSNRGDTDNMLSACKAYLDGIADAAGVNDRNFDIDKPVRGEPNPPHGRVVVEIEPIDTWEHISEPLDRALAAIPVNRRSVA